MSKVSTAFIFGGSGYIGSNLALSLAENKIFDKIWLLDIKEPSRHLISNNQININYLHVDVRKKIDVLESETDLNKSWVFNFAAVHREPGHKYQEYFDTNIHGAENVCDFARRTGIKNILFTSSIAPYGKSLEQRTENSSLYPETAYGISKALAEKIHETWLAEDKKRRLIIVRPSVIFGPCDPGNVYRMIKSLKKGTFVLPDGGKVIKGYGYVYGLVESMVFTMNQDKRFILYNYAENPLVPLEEMVRITKDVLKLSKPTFKIPVSFLAFLAFFIQILFKLMGKESDIHPVRVRKAGFPTNIRPQYLIDNGFEFKYNYREALKHWQKTAPKDFDL